MGSMFGRYQIVKLLGKGGMGQVYLAYEPNSRQQVALKTLHDTADAMVLKRFLKEAEVMARLDHPHIVKIFDVGDVQGKPYLVMEFVAGDNLAQLLEQQKFTVKAAVELMHKIAQAIQYAHSQGILHRDLKPSNIMLDSNGEPKVMDFGLALDITRSTRLSKTGVALGTPTYMPPEQARGQKKAIDRQSDVYSWGAMFYEVLTGRPPFIGTTPSSVLLQVVKKSPLPPSRIVSKIPKEIDNVCLKTLAKEKQYRYADMQTVIEDLDRFLTGKPVLAKKLGLGYHLRRLWYDNPFLLGISVTGMALLVTLVGLFYWQSQRISPTDGSRPAKVITPPTGHATKAPPGWPLSLWESCWRDKQNLVDFTKDAWLNLSSEQQGRYAQMYQSWYAQRLGSALEKIFCVRKMQCPMRLAPPGIFWMCRSENNPGVKVLISKPFWIGKYEVTQLQWTQMIGFNPARFHGDDKPVECIDWADCQNFCRATGMRLPTEAEWEYACRSGTTGAFAWGDEHKFTEANFASYWAREDLWTKPDRETRWLNRQGSGTKPVGSFPPNWFGLFDMCGNVWEWGQDWYAAFPEQLRELLDPEGAPSGTMRVIRGGSWFTHGSSCQSGSRGFLAPREKNNAVGMRVCRNFP